MENLALLRDPHSGVNIALVQGGSVGQAAGELESLGTLFYEPLWIFHRGGLEGETLAALSGRKVSIGPVGNGSHALLLKLLKRNDVDQDVGELLADLRELNIAPHVAQNTTNRASAIDGRTTRHPGYAVSQIIRKRIEESFAWTKTIAGLHKTKHRGVGRVAFQFVFAMAAYNLIRMPRCRILGSR